MAILYQPTYTRIIPANAEHFERDGIRMVRWDGRGRKVIEAQLTEKPGRCLVRIKKWWIEYVDHVGRTRYVPAYVDRMASERKAIEIRTRNERIRAGDLSPAAEKREDADLETLLKKWRKAIAAKGNSVAHADLYCTRVRTLLEVSEIDRVGKISKSDIQAGLAELRENGTERAATRGVKSRRKKLSSQTCNHYLTAAKAFATWLIEESYLSSDPISSIKPFPEGIDHQRERRALSPEDFAKLINAASVGPERSGLAGPDRAMLYLVAACTGLRRGELASLSRSSFRLADGMIDLQKRDSKNRKGAAQAIPSSILGQLSEWLKTRGKQPLWPGTWNTGRYASQMLTRDMEAAGIPLLDEAGRHFDFHALRGQYATSLARAGVPIQHAQKLMRHSTPSLTIKHYTKLGDAELATQASKINLPNLAPNLVLKLAETEVIQSELLSRDTTGRELEDTTKDDKSTEG